MAQRNAEALYRHQQRKAHKEAAAQERSLRQSRLLEKVDEEWLGACAAQ